MFSYFILLKHHSYFFTIYCLDIIVASVFVVVVVIVPNVVKKGEKMLGSIFNEFYLSFLKYSELGWISYYSLSFHAVAVELQFVLKILTKSWTMNTCFLKVLEHTWCFNGIFIRIYLVLLVILIIIIQGFFTALKNSEVNYEHI